jgi:hypothetical protein
VTKTLKPTAQSSKTAGRAAAVLDQLRGIFTSETGTVHICEVIQTVCAASSGLHGYKEILSPHLKTEGDSSWLSLISVIWR